MIIFRRLTIAGLLLVVGIAIVPLIHYGYSIEAIGDAEHSIRAIIEANPITAPIMAVVIYAGLSLVPGTIGKSIVAGWLFGLWRGIAIVIVGLTIAGSITYLISRCLLRDFIEHRFAGIATIINAALDRDGLIYLLTVRLASIPWSVVNWVCGATRVRYSIFLWTMIIGILPSTFVFVTIGSRLPSLDVIASSGVSSLITPSMIAAISALAFLPLLFRAATRHLHVRLLAINKSPGTSNGSRA